MGEKINYWLLKTEPAEYQIGTASRTSRRRSTCMKGMRIGDLCFFYHSGAKSRRVAGVVRVVREWFEEGGSGAVDVEAVGEMKAAVGLAEMKKELRGAEFALFRQPRLSVLPVEEAVWERLLRRAVGMGTKMTVRCSMKCLNE